MMEQILYWYLVLGLAYVLVRAPSAYRIVVKEFPDSKYLPILFIVASLVIALFFPISLFKYIKRKVQL